LLVLEKGGQAIAVVLEAMRAFAGDQLFGDVLVVAWRGLMFEHPGEPMQRYGQMRDLEAFEHTQRDLSFHAIAWLVRLVRVFELDVEVEDLGRPSGEGTREARKYRFCAFHCGSWIREQSL